MYGCLLSKRPRWPEQPRMSVIDACVGSQWVARMQIEWHVKRLHHTPERTILRQIVVQEIRRCCGLRKTVNQCADHAQIFDTALQFTCCQFGRLHGQGSESLKTIRSSGYLFSQKIVGSAG